MLGASCRRIAFILTALAPLLILMFYLGEKNKESVIEALLKICISPNLIFSDLNLCKIDSYACGWNILHFILIFKISAIIKCCMRIK